MTQAHDSSGRLSELVDENQVLRERYDDALAEIDLLKRDVEALHDIGIYNYRHPLENAVAYQDALDSIKTQDQNANSRRARDRSINAEIGQYAVHRHRRRADDEVHRGLRA